MSLWNLHSRLAEAANHGFAFGFFRLHASPAPQRADLRAERAFVSLRPQVGACDGID